MTSFLKRLGVNYAWGLANFVAGMVAQGVIVALMLGGKM